MNASPLLLEGYYLRELSVKTCADCDGNGGEVDISPGDLKSSVKCDRSSTNPRRWEIGLRVELPESSDQKKFRYTFVIDLVGLFQLAPGYPLENSEMLIRVNGPSILYSAARDILATATGRRSFPAVLLPPVNFLPSPGISDSFNGADLQRPSSGEEFGFPERRLQFGKRYGRLLQSMANLKVAWDFVLKNADTKTQDAKVVYGLGRIPLEDEFQAIILLCANGYSDTAKITLRALFEKVVTLLYLKKHPDEMPAFIDYSWIDRQKESNRIAPILAKKPSKRSLATQKEIKAKYSELRHKYPNRRWAKADLMGMAKDVGIDVGFTQLAYYGGIAEAHPKLIAILKRIEQRKDGSLWWRDELPDIEDSRITLMLAHFFVLKALEALHDYFQVEIPEEAISQCTTDYFESWGLKPPNDESI